MNANFEPFCAQGDYLISGLYPGKNEAMLRGIAAKVELLPKALLSSDMYIALSKQSKCYAPLSAGFTVGIQRAVERGRVKQMLDRTQSKLDAAQKPAKS